MKKNILILIIILIILVFSTGNLAALTLTQSEPLEMLIDISPYITIDVGDKIDINVEKPWQGAKLEEVSSSLRIQTNTDIELSWETTPIINEETKRVLPLGIPINYIQRLGREEKVEAFDQPFGLNTYLVNTGSEFSMDPSKKNIDNTVLTSLVYDQKTLKSDGSYQLEPGIHKFDIIVQYYWALESKWSQIIAGEYTGKIIYTVAAIDNGNE
jgi:hypothetical protein